MPLPSNPDDLWNEDLEKAAFQRSMYKFMVLGFLKGVAEVGGKSNPEEFFTATKRQLYFGKSLNYAAQTVGTTKKALQKEITAAIENDESVQKLAGRINELYGSSMGYRSVRIARTQLTNTIGDGNLTALIDEGQEAKQWSTVIDGRERETHHEANGQVVAIQEPFMVGGYACQRPGDDDLPPEEAINCRCDLVAADLSERQRRTHGHLFLRVHGALERRYVVNLRAIFRAERDRIISRLSV